MIVEILNSDVVKAVAEWARTEAWATRVNTICGWVVGLTTVGIIAGCVFACLGVAIHDHFRRDR